MKNKKRFFLFAGDQKIEHLNRDFFGEGIPDECKDPEHLFKIASKAPISAFASQLGLIELYGGDYASIPYLVKLNSKSDLISTQQKDPLSLAMHSVEDVVEFRDRSKLSIIGVGYTVYLGSEYEVEMLREAAKMVNSAHKEGLIAVLWMYPRGKAVRDERATDIIAGAAGVAACLGADFVKVNPPRADKDSDSALLLRQAVAAAGRTGVICSGGSKKDKDIFLQMLRDQIDIGGACGCAVGRNIYQRPISEAVDMCKEVARILKLEA